MKPAFAGDLLHIGTQPSSASSSEYSDAPSDMENDEYDATRSQYEEADDADGPSGSDDVSVEENVHAKGKGRARDSEFTSLNGRADLHSSLPPQQKSTESRSWTDLNLSIIIALISPIGNWLTGSDHVKHLCLLLLLIYYLHQLVEVPWQLYHKSRPHPEKFSRLKRKLSEVKGTTHKAAELALSELRSLELLFLALSVFAPFVGAHLIRHIFAAMEVDTLSWFSTTLFVLATGVRPWSHLVKRLHQRTEDLQETIDRPFTEERSRIVEERLAMIITRLEAFEDALQDLKESSVQAEPLQDVCHDLTEALGDLERVVHRQERRSELARVSHNNRLAVLETGIQRLEDRDKKELVAAARSLRTKEEPHSSIRGTFTILFRRAHEVFKSTCDAVLSLLPTSLTGRHVVSQTSSSPSPPLSPSASSATILSPSSTATSIHYFNGTPLETIPEAADSDSEGTYVSDKDASAALSPRTANAKLKLARSRSRSRSRSHRGTSNGSHSGSYVYSNKAIDFIAAVASWPYRVAVGVLGAFVPEPIQKALVRSD